MGHGIRTREDEVLETGVIVKTTETLRETAIRRVMRTVARHGNTAPLVRDPEGRAPIVVALPDDAVADVEAQRERLGGVANLFVAYPDKLILLNMVPTIEVYDVADVHPNSTIDMVLGWLRARPEETGTIRVGITVSQDVRELEYAL